MQPKEQRRLLLLVFLIGGSILLVMSFSQWVPHVAQLLGVLRHATNGADSWPSGGSNAAVDTQLPSQRSTTPEILSRDSSQGPSDASESARTESEISSTDERKQPPDLPPRASDAVAHSWNCKFTVSDIDFTTVRDDQPFRSSESRPWFAVLARLKAAEAGALAAASSGWVTFAELYRRSGERRGHVVTVRGRIVQATRLNAPKNDVGIQNYYQLWLWPTDKNNPIVIYALSIPPGFPVGERLDESVEIHGVFFKRWAYQAQDTLRSAPVLLAKGLHWHRDTREDSSRAPAPIPAMLIAILCAAGFVWYVYHKTRPAPRQKAAREANTTNSD